jgi:murein DD-endopeptidase MepM/ murein hydrolase activator NlpD
VTRLALAVLLCGACAAPLEEQRGSTIRVSSSTSAACAPLDWPVRAEVSSPFGRRDGREHTGVDLAVPEGTPVVAACDGIVRTADARLRGYGKLVIVEHADGLSTYYAHNRELSVRAGEVVRRGQPLSLSGATGHVTAPHLHFEVRKDGIAVDPLGLLGARPPEAGLGYALTP